MIWIGTSGFQYPEWKGKFYPETLPLKQMLPFYAERFTTTEINYSLRRIPSEKTIANWSVATPEKFQFSLKAPQKVTHFAKLRDCRETVAYFAQVIAGLGNKLGVVLFQLPPGYHRDEAVLETFLSEVAQLPIRIAFEFRDVSWFNDAIYETLRRHKAALCIAESADLSTPVVVTADFGYLRLRREDYSAVDIEKWAARIQELKPGWKDTLIYFKHEETGVGPVFAKQMLSALELD